MNANHCHAESGAVDARDLILRVLSLRKVADWAAVSEAAVSKWLSRGTADAPIPAAHVPAIAKGAVAEGMDFDVGLLWPAMAGWTARGLCSPPPAADPQTVEAGAAA